MEKAPTRWSWVNLVALAGVSVFALVGALVVTCAVAWWIVSWLLRRRRLQEVHHRDIEPAGGGAAALQLDPKRPKNLPVDLPPVVEYEQPSGASPETCTVCTEDVAAGEEVRRLPRCSHVFHRDCIDRWLMRSPTCPVCRSPVASAAEDH